MKLLIIFLLMASVTLGVGSCGAEGDGDGSSSGSGLVNDGGACTDEDADDSVCTDNIGAGWANVEENCEGTYTSECADGSYGVCNIYSGQITEKSYYYYTSGDSSLVCDAMKSGCAGINGTWSSTICP